MSYQNRKFTWDFDSLKEFFLNYVLSPLLSLVGYYECATAASQAAKTVTASWYNKIREGGSMKIKFTHKNTAASGVTLKIGSAAAKPLYYEGAPVDATKTWDDGETVEVYYDGTSYYANNVAGGSGGDGAFDLSAKTGDSYETLSAALTAANSAIPPVKKKGGMSMKFILHTPASYSVVKTEGLDEQPSGYVLMDDPGIGSGTYNAGQLSAFGTKPTSVGSENAVTYYMADFNGVTTYTKWVITLVQSSVDEYVQYRLMADEFSTTSSDWQSLNADDEPTAGSENLVKSGGIAAIYDSFDSIKVHNYADDIDWEATYVTDTYNVSESGGVYIITHGSTNTYFGFEIGTIENGKTIDVLIDSVTGNLDASSVQIRKNVTSESIGTEIVKLVKDSGTGKWSCQFTATGIVYYLFLRAQYNKNLVVSHISIKEHGAEDKAVIKPGNLPEQSEWLVIDNTPTEGSDNPVKSGGVYAVLNNIVSTNVQELTDAQKTQARENIDIEDIHESFEFSPVIDYADDMTWEAVYDTNTNPCSVAKVDNVVTITKDASNSYMVFPIAVIPSGKTISVDIESISGLNSTTASPGETIISIRRNVTESSYGASVSTFTKDTETGAYHSEFNSVGEEVYILLRGTYKSTSLVLTGFTVKEKDVVPTTTLKEDSLPLDFVELVNNTTDTATKASDIAREGYGLNPFTNKPFYYHFEANAFIKDGEGNKAIASESVEDVAFAARLGFSFIEANIQPTSDGHFVCIHGSSGTFGNSVKSADENVISTADLRATDINSVTLDWIKSNVIYASDYVKYQTKIPSLEEFCQACKENNIGIFAGTTYSSAIAICRKYLGNNVIIYQPQTSIRNYFNGLVFRFQNNSSKTTEDLLNEANSYGAPYMLGVGPDLIEALENNNALDTLIQTMHTNGYLVGFAGVYQTEAQSRELLRVGMDFSGSGHDVNPFEANYEVFDIDSENPPATATDGVITLQNGDSFTCGSSTKIIGKGCLAICFSGKLTINFGSKGSTGRTITSDGSEYIVISDYFFVKGTTLVITAGANTSISRFLYKTSKC